MSTHATVGGRVDSRYLYRYIHLDGYPNHVGATLAETYDHFQNRGQMLAWVLRPTDAGYWSSLVTPADFLENEKRPVTVPCVYCGASGIRDDAVGRSLGYDVNPPGCNGCRTGADGSATGQMSNPARFPTWVHDSSELDNAPHRMGAHWHYLITDLGLSVRLSALGEQRHQLVQWGTPVNWALVRQRLEKGVLV